MDINELKKKIEDILEEIEKGQYFIEVVKQTKAIAIILLLTADNRIVNSSIDEMREAIKQLESEEKIIVFPPDMFFLNLLEKLGFKTNKDGIFVQSYIMKANKELIERYKKLKKSV